MPQKCLPGTNIQLDLQGGQDYRLVFDALFAVTGGIYLSQLTEMVGESGPTLQNWVKRGFVSNPVGKKYTRRQTCRIILIAMLRHAMPLDDVANLLSIINHDLAVEEDDLIDDGDLYMYFCDIVLGMPLTVIFQSGQLMEKITNVTRDFNAGNGADKDFLNQVLLVIVLSYGSTLLQEQAKSVLREITETGPS